MFLDDSVRLSSLVSRFWQVCSFSSDKRKLCQRYVSASSWILAREGLMNELNGFCTWPDYSLTQDWNMTGARKMPEICSFFFFFCFVKGMEVLRSVASDLLHLLYAMWKHLYECYLAWCVELWEQWYCSLGYFYPWLSFVSGSIRRSSCALSDTELQLSSERLLVASHQHVSSLWLSSVKEAIGNGWGGV